eukprot:TRINITY_DN14063_c0_g1_i2.p1 TRINITY_DN14063_c0_g1~~TRINITY_DN14063_c0_g1_i2.p1  ORF type:complete len:308 (+),score=23.38 TRINITY_DN14063_c0_g1_i2:224-1147(+)
MFGIELLIQVIAHGLFFNWADINTAYLRNSWNVFDFIITLTSIISLLFDPVESISRMKLIRFFRSLRVLRLLVRSPHLRLVITSWFQVFSALRHTVLVLVTILYVLALATTVWFSNRLGPSPSLPHFETVSDSFFTMLIFVGGQGWSPLMKRSVDEGGKWNEPWRQPLFVCIAIIGHVLLFNFFVSTVVDTFKNVRDEATGSLLLSPEEKEWIDLQRAMMKKKPLVRLRRPSGFRGTIFDLVHAPAFEGLSLLSVAIVLGLVGSSTLTRFYSFLCMVSYSSNFWLSDLASLRTLGISSLTSFEHEES